MQWIISPSTDPAYNLALEEVLLQSLHPGHPGYAMLWQLEPSVILGRHQYARQNVDVEQVAARGIQLMRRLTGGGAAYQDLGTLHYTFLHALEPSQRPPSLSESGKPIAEALRTLGFPVAFGGRNELLLAGTKVAGVAHYRLPDRLLHDGCLMVSTDLTPLDHVFKQDPDKFYPGVHERITTLSEYIPVTVDSVRRAIIGHCRAEFTQITPEQDEAAKALALSKYATTDWTLGAPFEHTERRSRQFSWGSLQAFLDVYGNRIVSCRLYGDVFGELTPIEDALRNVHLNREAIKTALAPLDIERLIEGARREEILNFLCS